MSYFSTKESFFDFKGSLWSERDRIKKATRAFIMLIRFNHPPTVMIFKESFLITYIYMNIRSCTIEC